ncbi:MAG: cupin domain-containing protein [Coraliomargarita sp.]
MTRAEILKANEAAEFETAERCAILELANDVNDPAVSVARARIAPGVRTAWHRLDGVAERYVILSGKGRVEIGDLEPCEVEVGHVVRIPPGVRQRVENVGSDDLVFYALCTPRFTPECYVDLEDSNL